MANPAESEVQNLLPVQAFFDAQGNFQTFIGQNKPFFATPDPQQSGLHITNSTIDSSVIGGITPAAGNFTTATVLTQPSSATDVVNLLALQAYAAGISWKQPCNVATLANITLSGLQTIDSYTVSAGDRVLVKNQTNAAQNGIYSASATAWTRTTDADVWDELIAAISFIEYGTQAGGAFFCTAQSGGTIDVTANIWAQFTTSATYTAGTGLTLTGFEFSITPVGTAGTYGSASSVPVFTTNASGQVSSVTNTTIAIGATQIASGTIDSARLSGSYSGITGLGTLTDLTVTNPIVGSVTGNAGTATTAVTATNLAGGATGSLPYQTAAGTTGFLAAGTNGQILALASGIPSWIDNQVGTVTSVSGTGTVSGISLSGTVTSTGSLTLGGTLDLSSPPTIGNTAPNTGRFTTLTVDDNTTLGSSNTDTVTFTARINSDFDPATDNAYDLGRTGHEWRNLFINGTANIDSLVADTADINAGTIDNTVIGATTPVAGTFTDLRFNGTLSLAGTTGTAGFVLTSNGASAPTWQANANGLDIVDDTTTNATRYLTFTSATSGSITTENVSSTKLQYNPSTGALITSNDASISGLTVGKGAGNTSSSTALGVNALSGSNTGNYNTAIGRSTLLVNTSGTENVAVGFESLKANTTGGYNVSVGTNAMSSNTTGGSNTVLGWQALVLNTTASNNTAVGYQAGYSNTTGTQNAYLGYQAGYSNTTTPNSTCVGYQAGFASTINNLTAIGSQSARNNTTGWNTAVGMQALFTNTTGTSNIAIGGNDGNVQAALYSNTTGSNNVAIGAGTLQANTTASSNTAVGYQAAYTSTTAARVTAIGNVALQVNTVSDNTAVGNGTLGLNTTGAYNVGVGCNDATTYSCFNNNTTGSNNTAMGAGALSRNTTANDNTAIGYQAGYSNTTGDSNTYLGETAGYTNSTGNRNTFIGRRAGYTSNLAGTQQNTFVGWGSGQDMTSGAKNTIIGSFSGVQGGFDIRTQNNRIVISDGDGNARIRVNDVGITDIVGDAPGNPIFVANNNNNSTPNGIGIQFNSASPNNTTQWAIQFGDSSVFRFRVWSNGNVVNSNNSYGSISDIKLKENIVDATPKLNKLMDVKVRNYNLIGENTKQIGVVAQELEEIFPSMVDISHDLDSEGNDLGTTTKSVKYSVFVPMLIKAIQELNTKVEAQALEIATLKGN